MAEFDPTKPVQTRDGRPARIICTDREHVTDNIVALVSLDPRGEHVFEFRKDGHYLCNKEDVLDLVNIPERRIVFWNTYNCGDSCVHTTLEDARAGCLFGNHYIGTIEIVSDGCSVIERKLHYLRETEND